MRNASAPFKAVCKTRSAGYPRRRPLTDGRVTFRQAFVGVPPGELRLLNELHGRLDQFFCVKIPEKMIRPVYLDEPDLLVIG